MFNENIIKNHPIENTNQILEIKNIGSHISALFANNIFPNMQSSEFFEKIHEIIDKAQKENVYFSNPHNNDELFQKYKAVNGILDYILQHHVHNLGENGLIRKSPNEITKRNIIKDSINFYSNIDQLYVKLKNKKIHDIIWAAQSLVKDLNLIPPWICQLLAQITLDNDKNSINFIMNSKESNFAEINRMILGYRFAFVMLSNPAREILNKLFQIYRIVIYNSESTQMNLDNVAICSCNSILGNYGNSFPEKSMLKNSEDIETRKKILKNLIAINSVLFEIPPALKNTHREKIHPSDQAKLNILVSNVNFSKML